MAFDWREYVKLAHKLSGESETCQPEAEYRSGVSRAYYGAFCYARNRAMASLNYSPARTAEDHRDLKEFLKTHGHAEAASSLDTLRQWRNSCDYDDNVAPKAPDILLYMALLHADAVIQGL